MATEISKTYNPVEAEASWYSKWEEGGYFRPSGGSAPAYTIVIPPPNVTGSLHMGHALNNTLQDILIRWRRMAGDRTLWVPGTDHGGIATQNVVEKLLRAEKKTRHDLGRESFLERMWQWRKESGDTILMQLKRLGCSLDWTRTRFTMDEVCSKAVRTAFVTLFKRGLIYRGPRMVNWCPRCQTALSDIEVEHEERSGKLWHIRYPIMESHPSPRPRPSAGEGIGALAPKGEGRFIVVATTRPETMLGDTAVAVHPKDPRYAALIGKTLMLPLMNREIPVIGDEAVDSSFGSGAVKVTPAHDATDFDIGERHHLPHEVVIGFDARMTARAGAYAGLDRMEARKKIVEDLDTQGLLEKTEDYKLAAAECYRCQTVIEPLVSEQWFMRMDGLASRAAQATRDGRVTFYPASWEKPFVLWLDHIKDWCVSRQIWWGHRIPVYYCEPSGVRRATSDVGRRTGSCKPIASVEPPASCPSCGSTDLTQDPDVLDTWFSSALWPFSVLGWPDKTEDLQSFYPTSVLVTGHEILYLWVARMVMMGLEFQNEVPFKHVFIHGIVRDKSGKKMSKSLGNVVDPLEKMQQVGTDALRFALASASIPGRDLHLAEDGFLKSRNFANKLWNASRFVMMNLEGFVPAPLPPAAELDRSDRWILHELQSTIDQVDRALAEYNLAEACRVLYEFIWGSYCDWFVEIAKVTLLGSDANARQRKQAVLVAVLDDSLRLLHPFMPYETEALYQALTPYLTKPAKSLMIAPWPTPSAARRDATAAQDLQRLQNLVTSVRTLRSEMNIPPGQKIQALVHVSSAEWKALLTHAETSEAIRSLTRADPLTLHTGARPAQSAFNVFDGGEVYIPLAGLIDPVKEKRRLMKNRDQLAALAARGRDMLENRDFLSRAPKDEIDSRRQTLEQTEKKIKWIDRNLEALS